MLWWAIMQNRTAWLFYLLRLKSTHNVKKKKTSRFYFYFITGFISARQKAHSTLLVLHGAGKAITRFKVSAALFWCSSLWPKKPSCIINRGQEMNPSSEKSKRTKTQGYKLIVEGCNCCKMEQNCRWSLHSHWQLGFPFQRLVVCRIVFNQSANSLSASQYVITYGTC